MTHRMTLTTLAALALASLPAASLAENGPARGPMPALQFEAIDADKDGKVTRVELDAFRAAEAIRIDTNADGKLDAAELTALHVARMTERADDMAALMVQRLDTDGDAALSAAEFAARPMPAMLFDRIDADSDGAITKAEADAARERMQGRMAGNGGKHGRHGGFWDWSDN